MSHVIDSAAALSYRWCLIHDVANRRGGYRLQKLLARCSAEVHAYPIAQPSGTLYIDLTDESWLSTFLARHPDAKYEPHIQRVLQTLIEPNDIVVDIGANLGWHTVLMSTLSKRVIAFEPNPVILPLLRKTLASCPNVELHECAVLDYSGTVDFFLSPNHFMGSIHDFREGAKKSVVPCKRLVDVVDCQPDLMKVDAEGSEQKILGSASSILDCERAPIVIYETWSAENPEGKSVLETFCKARFKNFFIHRDGRILDYFDEDASWCEMLAIPESRLNWAMQKLASAPPLAQGPRI